tara:strand:+ start:4070 stop:4288 length:219 start_codon:yes stop_codon:yes gene_type:complete
MTDSCISKYYSTTRNGKKYSNNYTSDEWEAITILVNLKHNKSTVICDGENDTTDNNVENVVRHRYNTRSNKK